MTSLMARCSSQAAAMDLVRLGPRPGTSIRRPGSSSMTSSVAVPKCATIFSAVLGPMPLIRPEPR